jgi:hypothetical protein
MIGRLLEDDDENDTKHSEQLSGQLARQLAFRSPTNYNSNSSNQANDEEDLADILALINRNEAAQNSDPSIARFNSSILSSRSPPPLPSSVHSGQVRLTLRCYSLVCIGKAELECSDKIILPQEALNNIVAYRLPYPLLFEISNNSNYRSSSNRNYCSVLEFSADPGSCYLPSWLMQNLNLAEGSRVWIKSTAGIKPGKSVELQPELSEFFDSMQQSGGPKYFLEQALRHYSVLTQGQTIQVKYSDRFYTILVKSAKPNPTISILGNVDLEVEFCHPESQGKTAPTATQLHFDNSMREEDEILKQVLEESLQLAKERQELDQFINDDSSSQQQNQQNNRRDEQGGDEAWSVSNISTGETKQDSAGDNKAASASKVSSNSPEEQFVTDSEEEEQRPAAIEAPTNSQLCPSCGKFIPNSSFSLHSAHCSRAFSRCKLCNKLIKRTEAEKHAIRHELAPCQCGANVEKRHLKRHKAAECSLRTKLCEVCSRTIKIGDYSTHMLRCPHEKVACSTCSQLIPRNRLTAHEESEDCRVTCVCGELIPHKKMQIHKEKMCANRTVQCPYCKLQFSAKMFTGEHENYCGSRTEQCGTCQKFIKLKDFDRHEVSNCAFPAKSEKFPQNSAENQSSSSGNHSNSANLLNYDDIIGRRVHSRVAVPRISGESSHSSDSSSRLAAVDALIRENTERQRQIDKQLARRDELTRLLKLQGARTNNSGSRNDDVSPEILAMIQAEERSARTNSSSNYRELADLRSPPLNLASEDAELERILLDSRQNSASSVRSYKPRAPLTSHRARRTSTEGLDALPSREIVQSNVKFVYLCPSCSAQSNSSEELQVHILTTPDCLQSFGSEEQMKQIPLIEPTAVSSSAPSAAAKPKANKPRSNRTIRSNDDELSRKVEIAAQAALVLGSNERLPAASTTTRRASGKFTTASNIISPTLARKSSGSGAPTSAKKPPLAKKVSGISASKPLSHHISSAGRSNALSSNNSSHLSSLHLKSQALRGSQSSSLASSHSDSAAEDDESDTTESEEEFLGNVRNRFDALELEEAAEGKSSSNSTSFKPNGVKFNRPPNPRVRSNQASGNKSSAARSSLSSTAESHVDDLIQKLTKRIDSYEKSSKKSSRSNNNDAQNISALNTLTMNGRSMQPKLISSSTSVSSSTATSTRSTVSSSNRFTTAPANARK